MKVAIIGLGQFGKSLATRLGRASIDVLAADPDLERVDDIKNEVSLAVRLDPTDENELKAQGLHAVDILVASITDNFETNELVVVLAKRLDIKHVVALAASPIHARILRLIGADEVVLPDEEAVDRLFVRLLQPALRNYLQLTPGYTIAEIEAPADYQGKSIGELGIRARFGVSVIAIMRRHKRDAQRKDVINPVPGPKDVIQAGDILMLAGADADVQKIVNSL